MSVQFVNDRGRNRCKECYYWNEEGQFKGCAAMLDQMLEYETCFVPDGAVIVKEDEVLETKG